MNILMNNTVSIIGCGWLGFPLAQLLIRKGFVVKGSTRTEAKLKLLQDTGIIPFIVDLENIGDEKSIESFLSSDILIVNVPPGRSRRDVAERHPVEIKWLVNQAISCGVEKVLFVSSTSVYGSPNGIVTEADQPLPKTPSGKALLEIENWLINREAIDVTVLRMGGLVGGERKAGRFLAGKKEVKNGKAPVNMIHREDAVAIIITVIENKAWNKIYNCCADEHPTRAAFYHHQALKAGFEPPTFQKEGSLVYKIVSNEKIKRELDYRFVYPDPMVFQ